MEIPCDTIGQAVAGYLDAGDFTNAVRAEPYAASCPWRCFGRTWHAQVLTAVGW